MAKATLLNDPLYSITNTNNDRIEAALEKMLSRDGTSPNAMEANLDMNSNRILNLPTPVSGHEAATKEYADLIYGAILTVPVITETTTERIIADDDMNSWISCTNSSPVTITLNTGVGDVGKSFLVEQAGSGQVSLGGTATVRGANGTNTFTQYSVIGLFCVAADTWTCFGDTTA